MLIRQIEDEEERKEPKFPIENTSLTEDDYKNLSNPLRYPNHFHSEQFFQAILAKVKQSVSDAFQNTPRYLNVGFSQFCQIVHKSASDMKLNGLELFFPEVKHLNTILTSVTGVVLVNGEALIFETNLSIEVTLDDDLLVLYASKIESLDSAIQATIKSQVMKGLNFFLQNTYNLEKYWAFILESNLICQTFETVVKGIVTHDLSIMLENPFALSTRETIKGRLNKYVALFLNPLKKLNVIHFREYLNQGEEKKIMYLEHYIHLLVYIVELLSEFVRKGEVSFASFFWQSKLKVCLKVFKEKPIDDITKQQNMENFMNTMGFTLNNLERFPNLLMISLGTRSLSENKFSIAVSAFDKSIPYGWQPTRTPFRLIYSPSSERCAVNLLLELTRTCSLSIRGHHSTGKKTLIYHLADVCGKYCNLIDLSVIPKPMDLLARCMAAAGSQYWSIIEGAERSEFEILSELSKIILGIKKQYSNSGKKIAQIDKMEYLIGHECAFIMVQTHQFTAPQTMKKIPEEILVHFRCSILVSIDLQAFICCQLSELQYYDDFDMKQIDQLSKSLYLLFQCMHSGLHDKVFATAAFHNEFPPNVEDLLHETSLWKASLRNIRLILERIKHGLRTESKSLPISKIVFKAVYSVVKSQLNTHQKDSLMITYLSIFEPEGNFFKVRELELHENTLSLYPFFANNKMPNFTNPGLIDKVYALTDSLIDEQFRIVVNVGSNLPSYSQDFNKLQFYSYSMRAGLSQATGNSC
jgi:hypothetical protein